MRRSHRARCAWPALLCIAMLVTPASSPRAETPAEEVDLLKQQVGALMRRDAELQQTVQQLQRNVDEANDRARAAEDTANQARDRLSALPAVGTAAAEPAIFSGRVGRTKLQILDLSLDVLANAGFSSATDAQLETLQGGDHDPRQRGFSLPQTELSFLGAIDPFFTGEVHLIYFLDTEGESRFELEEAFVQTLSLPFGLERHGFQLELGQFFTEFGRLNPTHPHAWNWVDQPVILSRLFGEDGMRGPGVRLGWLTPLPWFSELHLGLQTAKGETMLSFLASDEVFGIRPIGGRPFGATRVRSANDLVKLLRWVNGFDLSETLSTQIGISGLLGPNASGPRGRTLLYGLDVVAKWRPLQTDAGWPFVIFEAELLKRHYRADSFRGCLPEAGPDCTDPVFFARDTLEDWGLYAQMLWGFRRSWAVGLRYEQAGGDADSLGFYASRGADPYRSARQRISPLLVFHPSHFSRIRLQYNHDRADDIPGRGVHSLWAGIEFLFGAHGAHSY